ncbi:MAG: hypothetical protein ACM3ZC_10780, partial [Bacteroidota bacterium]
MRLGAKERIKHQILLDKLLNDFSISQKMILIFVGCVIVPLLIQNIFYYNATEKNVQSEVMQRLTQSLREKSNKIKECISEIIALSLRYNNNLEIYKFLDTNYSNSVNYFNRYQDYQDRIKNVLISDLTFNTQMTQLILYTDNPTIVNGALVRKITSGNFNILDEKLLDYRIDTLTSPPKEIKLRIALVPTQLTAPNDRSLSIIRPLRYYQEYSRYQKIVRIDLNLLYIASILRENDLFDNIILVDKDNRIIAAENTYHEFGAFDIFSDTKLKKGIVVLK